MRIFKGSPSSRALVFSFSLARQQPARKFYSFLPSLAMTNGTAPSGVSGRDTSCISAATPTASGTLFGQTPSGILGRSSTLNTASTSATQNSNPYGISTPVSFAPVIDPDLFSQSNPGSRNETSLANDSSTAENANMDTQSQNRLRGPPIGAMPVDRSSLTVTPDMIWAAYESLNPTDRRSVLQHLNRTSTSDFSAALASAGLVPRADPTSPAPIDPDTDIDSSPPMKLLYSASDEQAFSVNTLNRADIHPYIIELAAQHRSIPLTLFTASAIKRMFLEQSTLKMTSHICIGKDGTKTKVYLLDVSTFPSEQNMDPSDWHEAWNRFNFFLSVHADHATATRWKDHYDFLSNHDNFRDNFRALLRFDIDQRTRYFTAPQAFDPHSYYRRLETIKIEVMQEDIKNDRTFVRPDHDRTFRYPRRSDPYPRDTPRSSERNDSDTRPYRQRSELPPICFICQIEHRFFKCPETSAADGQPTFAKRLDKKLVRRDNNASICITFNASRQAKCDRQHDELHICSLCGASDHGVCARKCF